MPPRLLRFLPVVLLFTLACAFFSAPATPATNTPAALTPTVVAPAATATDLPPTAAAATSTPVDEPTATAAAPTGTAAAPTTTPAPDSLNPSGPYVLYSADSGVWISNPDGSFLTLLYGTNSEAEIRVETDLRDALSPAGDQLALVVSSPGGLDLVLVAVPSGEARTVARLSAYTAAEEQAHAVTDAAFAKYAVRDYNSVAWQPSPGHLLAVIGVMEGPTADLYLFDTETNTFSQMTDGLSQAVLPSWSPDGQYVLQYGVSWVEPLGGALGPANQLDGVWAVRVSDGAVLEQPKPVAARPINLGWTDATHYLTYDDDEACISRNLRTVDVTTGAAAPVIPYSFYYYIARSPENGALLFSGTAGCDDSVGEGTFILPPGETTPTQLDTQKAFEISWLPESGLFQAYPQALYSADGQTRYDPPVDDSSFYGVVSSAGDQAWRVIQNRQPRIDLRSPGGDWRTILEEDVTMHLWAPGDARVLLMAASDGTLYAAAYPDFAPVIQGDLAGRVDEAVWVPAPPAQ